MSPKHLYSFVLAFSVASPGCATRVGNPPKPNPASVQVPQIAEFIPSASTSEEAPAGGFAGAADFLKSLSSAAPNQREVLAGMNAMGRYLDSLELELDVAKTQAVEGVELKAVVRGDPADAAVRRAVLCANGALIYTSSWKDGGTDLNGVVDLKSDYTKSFAKIAEADRQFQVSIAYVKTEARSELDMTLAGVPVTNDPFVGELGQVLERARYRSRAVDTKVVYQAIQVWSEGAPAAGAIPQVTVAGLLATDGRYQYALHHTEAKLVCPTPLNRDGVAEPGWCVGFDSPGAGVAGAFTDAAAAQTLWDGIKDDGLLDPAATVTPALVGECPQ